MKVYADLPARRVRQVLSDLGLVLWCLVWAWVGRVVHDGTLALAAPGRQLISTGQGFGSTMTKAGDSVDNLPLLGDKVATPFRSAAQSGADLEATGRDLVSAVERLATLLGWTTALVPIVIAVSVWAFLRGRFVRRAAAAQRFIDADADLDLFALRAMARQPMHVLGRISDDPAGAWRRGDADVVRALGALELRSAGLRPPA